MESNEADYDLLNYQKVSKNSQNFKKVYTINGWQGFGTSFNHNSEIIEIRKHLDGPSNIFIFENVEDLQWWPKLREKYIENIKNKKLL